MLRTLKNQFLGINPLVNSQLQQPRDEWKGFHTAHLGDLTKLLKLQLRQWGYDVRLEKSLQLRFSDGKPKEPESDILILDPDLGRMGGFPTAVMATATELVLPTTTAILDDEDDHDFVAIGIYAQLAWERGGQPVAWLELLSPTNKTVHFIPYRDKRYELILNGVVFVELDYLHETPPTVYGIPRYRPQGREGFSPKAYPYRIVVTDPRPSLEVGKTTISQWLVDESLPTVKIPLNGADILAFDFNAAYQKTFEEMFYGDQADYEQLPINFATYSPTDQLRIMRRLLTIREAHQQGLALESAPLPLAFADLTLEEGFALLGVR